jgi:small subunit ribosomal protein S6
MTLLQKAAITAPSIIATSTAEENKVAESRAKDAAAREVVAVAVGDDDIDLDELDEDFDADALISE